MEIVVSIVGKIGEYLVPPFGEHVGYLISYKKNIMKVNEHYQKLLLKKEAVQQSVEGANWNQQVIAREVQTWQTNVDIRIEELRKFLEEDVNADTMCLNGWCPDLKSRYSLGKKAQKNTQAINELLQEGKEYDRVFNPAPPLEVGSTSNGRFKNFESRKTKINQVLEALRDDKMDMIAICGMGGIGKTEMAKEIAKRVKDDNLFDKVPFAMVSQVPDLKQIQAAIAECLGPKLNEESLTGRATQLHSRLVKNKKVLIILDDVWEPLDLEAIGIHHGDKDNSWKILLTSRNEETWGTAFGCASCCAELCEGAAHSVAPISPRDASDAGGTAFGCASCCAELCEGAAHSVAPIQMNTQKNFPIELLSKEEAWNFFREMVGDSCIGIPSLRLKAKMVEEECGRLPIAIAIVGSAMKDNSDENVWDAALEQLKKSIPQYIPGLNPKVYASIEFSYIHLKSKDVKSCFLLCCLFPEDYDIPIEDLVRYGVGRRLFANIDTIAEARRRVHAIVQNLKRSNLLLDSGKKEFIKMHDVVRDVAISIASRDEHGFMVRYDVGLEEWPQNDTYEGFAAISLMLGKTTKHPEGLNCSRLQLLRLSSSAFPLPPNMFDGMKELRVLSLERMSLEPLPPSIQVLKNLRMLMLEYCSDKLKNVSIIGALEKLEMLSFCGSEIEEVPKEIGNLSQLKLLDVSRCRSLERIAAGVLSRLSRLEELYSYEFDKWKSTGENGGGIDNANLAEIIPYSHQIMALEISLPSIKFLQQDLHFKNQKMKFRMRIAPRFQWLELDSTSEDELVLHGDAKDIVEKRANISPLLDKSQVLLLKNIKNSKCLLHDLDRKGFPCLKDLQVYECKDEEYLLDVRPDDTLHAAAFPLLESLKLTKLANLKEIYHSKVSKRPFSGRGALNNLRSLQLCDCGSLKHVFSMPIVSSLVQLQELHVSYCKNIEQIFSFGGGEHKKALSEMNLAKLTKIILGNLPVLIGFCKAMDPVDEHPQSTTQASLYQEIKGSGTEVTSVSHKLFSSNTISWIPNLEVLEVQKSHSLQVLFNLEGQKVKEDCTLSQLTTLYLVDLSALTHVWKNIPQGFQGFQNLMTIKISDCHNLTYLFSTSVAKLLVQLQEVYISYTNLMENIIQREQEAGEEREACPIKLPSIKMISLHKCPKLKTFGSETQSRRKQKKMDPKLDSRVQGSLVVRDSPDFLGGCLESCVPHRKNYKREVVSDQSISKRSKGSSSVGRTKHYNHGQIPNDLAITEVTLTKQEQSVTEETDNQVKIWSFIQPNLVESLQTLEGLGITACDLLEVIFQLEGLHVEESQLVFDNLTWLSLDYLPKLLHIWKKSPPEIRGFGNLKILQVSMCGSLKYLISPSVAKLLVKLEKMKVSSCSEMDKILAKGLGGEEEEREVIVFPRVTSLSLMDLPKLECFCNEANAFEWPSLEKIRIVRCNSLKMFVPTEMKTPNLQGVYTDYQGESPLVPMVGDLNATIQHMIIKGKAGSNDEGSN
ncbi:disease resistance protein At4g27190-like [Juglans regia]|uniref:Disease resistance protein At4g27190-like n=1 Tax=Juglans regia TaxID=51240 RepID=A0A6P9EF70_JUGRE|nr:disease resistance protein At4g27190-like [Juglans regia]